MPPYHDVYVLARERSQRVAYHFLATFAPQRTATTSEYSFPQYAEQPAVVCASAEEAIQYCTQYPHESQSFYFSNSGGYPAHVMLFFTRDGGLILGFSVQENEAEDAFERLKAHTGVEIGYITVESPPEETASEFQCIAPEHLRAYRAAMGFDEQA